VLLPLPVAAQNDDEEASPRTWGHFLPQQTPSELLFQVLPTIKEIYNYNLNY